ncbi:MAG: nucleotidyltransferase family protein [Actinomycetota bacterium]
MSQRLEYLRANSEAIRAIAARHKAFNVAVFGSVARGEDTPNSDIDILVDFLPGASLVDEFRLENELQEFLKTKVDLISRGGLKARDTHIREESMAL